RPMASPSISTLDGGGRRRGLVTGLAAGLVAVIAGGYFLLARPHPVIDKVHPDNQRPTDTVHHQRVVDETGVGRTTDPVVTPPPPADVPKDRKQPDGGNTQPPASTTSPWMATKASIGGMRADTAGIGVRNLVLTVYYSGPSKDTQATVECILRPD